MVLVKQQQWALAAGLTPNDRGYLESVGLNLRQPMSSQTSAAFERGDGGELRDHGDKLAKMRALHSSSALGVNVFSYWEDGCDLTLLLAALSVPGESGTLEFERKLPTGAGGMPPNLDVVITTSGGMVVGVESKFTEWMAPKRGFAASLAPYIAGESSYWSRAGLPEADRLARAVHAGSEEYRYLDVPQLLKHALGLEREAGSQQWALRYVYFAASGDPSRDHDAEIERFTTAVGGELCFAALDYQAMFKSFASSPSIEAKYVTYLQERYAAV